MEGYYTVKQITGMSQSQLVAIARNYMPPNQHTEMLKSDLINFVIENLSSDGRISPEDEEWLRKPFIGEIYIVEHGDPERTREHLALDITPGARLLGEL